MTVALRKESVDRNIMPDAPGAGAAASLSARRAWIEMCLRSMFWLFLPVALRKESVDRNALVLVCCVGFSVALRKESVDRNFNTVQIIIVVMRRSPQGERG